MRPLDATTVPLIGTHLIEASAGTGKTWTIGALVVRLVVERGLTIDQILVVTFTRAATGELRDRIRARLRDALTAAETTAPPSDPILAALFARTPDRTEARRALRAAVQDFDQAAIFTIHSFCQRMLQDNAFESGVPFDVDLTTSDADIQDVLAHDLWVQTVHDARPMVVQGLRSRGLGPAALAQLIRAGADAQGQRILPTTAPTPDLQASIDAALAARSHTVACWQRDRDALSQTLRTSKALNRNKFRATTAEQWIAHITAWAQNPSPDPSVLADGMDRLTPDRFAAGTKKGHSTPTCDFSDSLPALIDAVAQLSKGLDDVALQLRLRALEAGRTELPIRKKAARRWGFSDLLRHLDDALKGPSGAALARQISTRFQAALIDEFQDTDPIQYRIFRAAWHGRSGAALFLIGDPKQAIYAFRGADIFAYLHAAFDAADQAWTLDTNWRSDPIMVRGVNQLFARAKSPFLLPEIRFSPVKPRPNAANALTTQDGTPQPGLRIGLLPRTADNTWRGVIAKGTTNQLLPDRIAADIVTSLSNGGLLHGRPLRPGDVAVLVRTHAQGAAMQRALGKVGIPAVLRSSASVFQTEEAADLRHLLGAVASPREPAALRAALASPLVGEPATRIATLDEDEAAWELWSTRFLEWQRTWLDRGFMAAARQMLDTLHVRTRLLAFDGGERRLTNVLHLLELCHRHSLSQSGAASSMLRWLVEQAEDPESDSDGELRLESDAIAAQIVTVHKSKGLEYPLVWAPFLWDGRLPKADDPMLMVHDRDDADTPILDLGSDARERLIPMAQAEDIAEKLRLAYVALTRSRHQCTIAWGAISEAGSSALGYLLHQPVGAEAPLADAAAARLKNLDDEGIAEDIQRLIDASEGAVSAFELDEPRDQRWSEAPAPPIRLAARPTPPLPTSTWRASSFSALTRDAAHAEPRDAAREQDDTGADPAPRPVTGTPVPLATFPAGARYGNLLHDILEYIAFHKPADEHSLALVQRTLTRYGLSAETWATHVHDALQSMIDTPLHPTSLRLRDVLPTQRISEMEFVFPVGHQGARRLQAHHLATALRAHGGPGLPAGYADAVAGLGFQALQGWMRGFIDLIFEQDGRWYVVDWKSNRLGETTDAYGQDALSNAMASHHYALQYHLYMVALHRYLQLRLGPDVYDPATHLGGVFYLFLRGVHPDHPPGCGVFHDAPSPALIDALSTTLDHPGAP